jgi:predicted acylesterase/phospholipase RssA
MPETPSRPVEVGVVLQGGGALGAYECGALDALLELMDEFTAQGREIVLKVVTGVSIGSINAACVVGAKTRSDARARLNALWDDLMLEAPPFWMTAAQRDLAYSGCRASMRHGRISGPFRPGPTSTIPARCW